jgi:hypothetical protein
MRSSLRASEEVIEFHATEAYCNFGVPKVQYSVSRLCSDEKGKVTDRINHNSLIAWEKMLSTCRWKMKLCVYKHSQIPDAVCGCDRRCTLFVITVMFVWFSAKGNDSGFFEDYVHAVWNTPHLNIIYFKLEEKTVVEGFYFSIYFEITSKEMAIWILDRTIQVVYETVQQKCFKKWSLWYSGQHFTGCEYKYCDTIVNGQIT